MQTGDNFKKIDHLINPRALTRRQVLGLGALGTMFMLGGLSLSPAGRAINDRVSQEISHETIKAKLLPTPGKWSDGELTIAWLGHASFLVNLFGVKILIDPALEERIGVTPVADYTIGPRRYISSPLSPEKIGKIDLVLVSHAHTDHFDYPTLRKLQSKYTISVTAKNTKQLWQGMNFKSVEEMDWGERRSFAGVTVTAVEGKHWGARLPWQKGMEANSLLISKDGVNIFFGGDTGYTEKIKNQLEGIPIHLAIMGIAAYSPKSFEAKHATPEQAWRIAEEIGAMYVIPMHWGTFRLSQEPMDEPMQRFRHVAGDKLEKVALQEVGATFVLPKKDIG